MNHAWLQGYHSLQVYRVAHAFWGQGRKILALALQSRISEVVLCFFGWSLMSYVHKEDPLCALFVLRAPSLFYFLFSFNLSMVFFSFRCLELTYIQVCSFLVLTRMVVQVSRHSVIECGKSRTGVIFEWEGMFVPEYVVRCSLDIFSNTCLCFCVHQKF